MQEDSPRDHSRERAWRLPTQLERARVLACATQASGAIKWCTRAFRVQFGGTANGEGDATDPMLGPFIHASDWRALIAEALASDTVIETRLLMRARDGALRALRAAAAPAPEDCPYGSAALVMFEPELDIVPLSDIPGDGFRALYDNAAIGIYRSTAEGRPHRANPTFVRMMGYATEAEWLAAAQNISQEWYVDPRRRAEFVREIARRGSVANFVSEIYRHATGERIWISETAREVRDPDGRLAYYEGTVEDITDRVRSAEALQSAAESAERLSALVAGTLKRANEIAYVSPEDANAEGLRAVEAFLAEFSSEQARQSAPDELERFGECHRELAQLIRALIDAKQQAEAADRAKSQFLANVSHELRTPLNAIIGYAEILTEDCAAARAETSAEDARRINGAARHLLSLINSVLDLSQLETGMVQANFRPCALTEILDSAETAAMAQIVGNGNSYVRDNEVGTLTLRTDAEKLTQCLIHLLSNAGKFTRTGTVTLGVRMDELGQNLHFCVADTGIGMPPEQMARLFQPFTQVDASVTRRFGGAGLGLAIAKRFVEMLGGSIGVASTPGHGARFELSVPIRGPGVLAGGR